MTTTIDFKTSSDTPGAPSPGLKSEVSVIVPVVRRADDLADILERNAAVLTDAAVEFEFVFVFDAGFGPPPQALIDRARSRQGIRLIALGQSLGESAALRIGLQASTGSIIVTLPPYGQVEPAALRDLLDALTPEVDVAIARRWPRRDSFVNRVQSRVFHRLVRSVTGTEFEDLGCGVRAFRRDVLGELPLYGDLHRFLPAFAAREGYRVVEVKADQAKADRRRRFYSPGIYVRRLLDIAAVFFLLKFTEKPLRFFGLIGTALAAVGGLLTVVLGVQRLTGTGIANRPLLLVAMVAIALGVQLIGLGLVGEIIVHLRSSHRRSYRIREML